MFSTPPNRSSAAARMVDRVKLIRRRYWHDRTLPSPGGNTFFRLRGWPQFDPQLGSDYPADRVGVSGLPIHVAAGTGYCCAVQLQTMKALDSEHIGAALIGMLHVPIN